MKTFTCLLACFVFSVAAENCDCDRLWEAINEIKLTLREHGDKLSNIVVFERRTDKVYDWYWKNKDNLDKMAEMVDSEPVTEEAAEALTETPCRDSNMAELKSNITSDVMDQIQLEVDRRFESFSNFLQNVSNSIKVATELSLKQVWLEMDYLRKNSNKKVEDLGGQFNQQKALFTQTSLLLQNMTRELQKLRTSSGVLNQTLLDTEQRVGLIESRLFDAFEEYLVSHASEKFWNDEDATVPNKYNSIHEIIRRLYTVTLNLDKQMQLRKSSISSFREFFF